MIRYNSDKEISKKLSEILTEYHFVPKCPRTYMAEIFIDGAQNQNFQE